MKIGLVILCMLLGGNIWAQNPKFDQLELFYSQNHYKKVLRRSNQLIDNPYYDFSQVPNFYQAISSIQLSQNDHWRKKQPDSFGAAISTLVKMKNNAKGNDVLLAHQSEIEWLYEDMLDWASVLKGTNQQMYQTVVKSMTQIFDPILIRKPIKQDEIDVVINEEKAEIDSIMSNSSNTTNSANRNVLIENAKEQVGVPYKWSGTTPKGFDCSGFTSYIHEASNVQIPRRSADQFSKAKKVKRRNIQPGDLVFFKKSGKVNHVGVILSSGNDSLVMIHASTSRGVIVTNVEESEYWKNKIQGYGTFIH